MDIFDNENMKKALEVGGILEKAKLKARVVDGDFEKIIKEYLEFKVLADVAVKAMYYLCVQVSADPSEEKIQEIVSNCIQAASAYYVADATDATEVKECK